ncbi:hypothetical protein T01_7544 [Trichinella spiralis]|uniref:Uncharacterized protein n=1 Tax=Trichinella spiralis TaxID=6334 RepID=A0A0V0Z351_TRISP|nr:hypothetical protein T01_7544 [Trichinella spiralis]
MEAIHHLINFHYLEEEPHLDQVLLRITQYLDYLFQNKTVANILHLMH